MTYINIFKPWLLLVGIMACTPICTAIAADSVMVDPSSPVKLMINKDNIKVWTFKNKGNAAFSYRATTVLDTRLSTAVAVIMDDARLATWVPYTREVSAIDTVNTKTGDFLLRIVLDFPFPLSDRDVVVKGNISQQADGTVRIVNKSVVDSRVPERKDIVRIKNYEGSWTFKPLSHNMTEVSTEGFADPAGKIPLSIVNMFVQQQPFDMLKRMREQVKLPMYQSATVPRIIEPNQ